MTRMHVEQSLSAAAVFVGLVLFAPAAWANPRLTEVFTSHNVMSANGAGFPSDGSVVTLRAYGLGTGGSRTFITEATVVPSRTAMYMPRGVPCLLGPLCEAGGFFGPKMYQTNDPCVSGGFPNIEIDAFLYGKDEVAEGRATVRCLPPPH